MAIQTPQDKYLVDLITEAPQDHAIRNAMYSARGGHQRVMYTGLEKSEPITLNEVLNQAVEDSAADRRSICIIENINPEYMGVLGPSLWESVMGRQARDHVWDISTADWDDDKQNQISQRVNSRQCHVEGIFEHLRRNEGYHAHDRFQRHFEYDAHYGWQANTQISYYRVSMYLYLIIVDRPFTAETSHANALLPSRLSLFVPYSWNYRGLSVPQLYEQDHFSSFDTLRSFFSYRGNVRVMFSDNKNAIDFVTLAYFMSSSLWLTNIRYLSQDIQRIAFKDIRRPTIAMNDQLHDRRRDLALLKAEVQAITTWIRPKLNKRLDLLRAEWAPSPKQSLETVLAEAADLDKFLMDTFQLLMSSMSVRDSQISIQHAERSTHLTLLATIYVPLSFVTGIFGMNLKEINGSPLPWYAFAIALLNVVLCTLIFRWMYIEYRSG